MAVFSTNLIIYKHTDFEQTFVLEDSQTNSFKNLTDFTGTCKIRYQHYGALLWFPINKNKNIWQSLALTY